MSGQRNATPSTGETRVLPLLRALASPVRFRIVELLADQKDATSPYLMERLDLAQSTVHEHLAVLRKAGIVQASGEGPHRYYCLAPAVLDDLGAYLAGVGQRARSWRGLVEQTTHERTLAIRDATAADAAPIARIYNQGIEDRVATLETELRSPAERAEWLAARGPRHPVIVALDSNDTLVGWGSLNPFNPRPAYQHVADFSLYVERNQRGRGIGDALLGALEMRSRALGYHKMVLSAFPTNAPGMRLYQRHGFTTVGIYRQQGLLDGQWVDTIIMERLLD